MTDQLSLFAQAVKKDAEAKGKKPYASLIQSIVANDLDLQVCVSLPHAMHSALSRTDPFDIAGERDHAHEQPAERSA